MIARPELPMIVRIFPKYSSARRGERESTFSENRNAGLADAAPDHRFRRKLSINLYSIDQLASPSWRAHPADNVVSWLPIVFDAQAFPPRLCYLLVQLRGGR